MNPWARSLIEQARICIKEAQDESESTDEEAALSLVLETLEEAVYVHFREPATDEKPN